MRKGRASLAWLLATAVTLPLAGCDSDGSGPRTCTLIGCVNTLTVELPDDLPVPFEVRAEPLDGSGGLQVIDCPGDVGCGEASVTFRDFVPTEVRITVVFDGTHEEATFTPEYETSRPNGPDCPPECMRATVAFEHP